MQLDDLRTRLELARFGGVWLTPGPHGRPAYRSLRSLTAALRALTALSVVVALGLAASSLLGLIEHRGRFASFDPTHTDAASLTGRLQWLMAALLVMSGLTFMVWATRAYRNLPLLAVEGLQIPTRWAWAVWFVPFGNLIWAKELVDDVYRASDPSAPVLSPGWRAHPVPWRVHLWWISVLTSGVLLLSAQWALPAPPPGTDPSGAELGIIAAAHLLVATGAVLTGQLVTEVATRQRRRVDRLGVAAAGRPGREPAMQPRPQPEPARPLEQVPALVHVDTATIFGRY
jgi:hypothetical protein